MDRLSSTQPNLSRFNDSIEEPAINPEHCGLPRLIHLLLDAHPNTFAAALVVTSTSTSKEKEPIDGLDRDSVISILTPCDLVDLNRDFGLGLGIAELLEGNERAKLDIDNKNRLELLDFDWTWEDILRAYIESDAPSDRSSNLPPAILSIITHVHEHSTRTLPRAPIYIPNNCFESTRMEGMSPKKAHEVSRMAAYVAFLVKALSSADGISCGVYIVDVGAGQGHLARELLRRVPGVKGVLALDGDEVLVDRERQREKESRNLSESTLESKVSHKVGHIKSAQGVADAVDEWIEEQVLADPSERNDLTQVIPVVLVSLHGCGSLSLDVLRAFGEHSLAPKSVPSSTTALKRKPKWGFIASVTVPCCYNLLREDDAYPLCSISPSSPSQFSSSTLPLPSSSDSQPSSAYDRSNGKFLLPLPLPPSAYHLAAQVPHMWVVSEPQSTGGFGTTSNISSTSLAVRKVVWRALLECILVSHGFGFSTTSHSDPSASDLAETQKGHGRRNRGAFIPPMEANAYFATKSNSNPESSRVDSDIRIGQLKGAELGQIGRLGRLPSRVYNSWDEFLHAAGERLGVDLNQIDSQLLKSLPRLERALGILHVLRCILGPLVESAFLEDRVSWVREMLALEGKPERVSIEREAEKQRVGHCNEDYTVSLIPLFSQFDSEKKAGKGSGSARNVAVVVLPAKAEIRIP